MKKTDHQLHLEEFLPYRLSRLSNLISASIAATYQRTHSLSVTEWRVIAILGRFTGLSAREVAEKGALDKVAVSRAVNRLIENSVLDRDHAKEDRRRSVLKLTVSGRRIYKEISPAALQYEQQLLEILKPEELIQLDQLLETLWHRAKVLKQE